MQPPQHDGLRWLLASMIGAMLPLHVVVFQIVSSDGPPPEAVETWSVQSPTPEEAPATATRGSGPSEAEWQAIGRFESFKDAAYRGDRAAVDAGLTFFHELADRNPDDVGVRRIDLMALEQAIYYAREDGRIGRAEELAERFGARARGYEGDARIAAVRAARWVDELRSRADRPSCAREAWLRNRLTDVAERFPEEERLQELYRLHVGATALEPSCGS